MLCLALRLGGGCDISGQLSRGPFQIMLHCASLQWMTLLLPCNSTRCGQNNTKHRTHGVWKESGKTSLLKVTTFQIQKIKSKITLIQPKQPRPENWVSTTGQGPLKRCPKRCSERMEEKRVTWDELILIMLCVWRIRSCFCLAFYLVFLDTSWRENVFIQLSIHLFEIYICFNFVCLMLQLIYNHNAIFSLSCPLHQVPMADAIGTTWLWVHHHGRRWNRRQASQVQMRGQLAGYTMKARLRPSWIWEASELEKFFMCKEHA